MTAFNRQTDLPAAIDTVEKLKVWVDSLLERLYGSKEYEETEGTYLQPVMDCSVVRTKDKKIRQISRSSIAISDDYVVATNQKFWTFAQPLGTVDIPQDYKVD